MTATATCELNYEPVTKPRMTVKQFLKLKPSALLRVALDDLAWVEKQPRMRIDMNRWLAQLRDMCYACFAGSVMARTFGARPNCGGLSGDVSTWDIDGHEVENRLDGLNHARCGQILDYLCFGFDRNEERLPKPFRHDGEFATVKVKTYSKANSAQFKRDMRRIARLLEAHGL